MSDIPAGTLEANSIAQPDEAVQPDYQSSLETARGAGFSWSDIWNHLFSSTAAADKAGYTQPEIDEHLGFTSPEGFELSSLGSWATHMAENPSVLDDMENGKVDLAAHPDMPTDYTKALLAGEVKGPQDFAERYGASAVAAAHEVHGLDDQDGDTHLAAASAAANSLAPTLPTREDLADATVKLGNDNPDTDPVMIRKNLMDHWAQTGVDPVEAAVLADRDPALNDKLMGVVAQPTPAFGYDPAAKINQYRDAIDGLYAPGEEIANAKSPLEAITDIAEDVRDIGTAVLGGEVIGRGAALAGEYVVQPLARAALRLAGEIPAALRDLMDKTTTSMVDFTKEPGQAISDVPVSKAMTPPTPAVIEPPEAPARPFPQIEEPLTLKQLAAPPSFAEASTPAERIARIAQDADPNDRLLNSGTYFQDALAKMGETDQATLDLARGTDNTASLKRWLWDIWSDENGAGPGFQPVSGGAAADLEPGSIAARDAGRDYAEGLIRHISTGLGTQKTENIAQAAEAFYKDLAPFMPRYERELAKPFGGDWANTEVGKFINAVEGQGTVHPDSPLHPLFQFLLDVNDKHRADINAAVARGDLNPVQFREFYLPHLYTPESISAVKKGTGTGGIQGSLGFTKPRTQPTYADAIGEGYKPLHPNPIIMMQHGLDASRKALNTVEMQGMAMDTNWLRYYTDPREAARDGFRPIVGLNSEKLVSTITKDAKGKTIPGPVIRQQLFGREGFDTIWNNWTRFDGLQRSQLAANAEDALLKIKNTSTYMKLILPLYHTATMYKEGWSNAWANAMTELAGGEIGRGIWDAAKAPIAPIEYVVKAGLKWRPMYRAMQADPALDAFVGGGGSLAARSKVYQAGSTPTLWRLWRRGTLTQDLAKDLTNALTFPATRSGGNVMTDVSNLTTVPFRELGRVTTSLSAPIWDHLVPLMKGGAALERIQTFIRQNPQAADDLVRDYSRRVVTNIEDRLGEYNSANLFWRPTVKRIANQTMLSTGWAYGTIHATLQGMGFNPSRGGWNPLGHLEWNPVATTNLAANLGMIAFTNAAWSYLVDGKLPENKLDYMIPFANARGIARVILPGEEKEYYDWMKIATETYSTYLDKGYGAGALQAFRSTGNYAMGKLAPPYQAVKDWMAGEYFNAKGRMTKITPTPAGMKDWLVSEFLPIFINSWDKNAAIGLNAVENMFGLREAPKWFENWDAWRQGQEKLHNQWTKQELKIAGGTSVPGFYTPPGEQQRGTGSRAAHVREFLQNETATPRSNQFLNSRAGATRTARGVENVGAAPRSSEEQVYTNQIGAQPTTVLRGNSPTLGTRPAPRADGNFRSAPQHRAYFARRGRGR